MENLPTLTFPQMLVHKFELAFVLLCWFLKRTFASERVLLLVMGTLRFRVAALLILFTVLFVWYEIELDGAVYIMAPIL